ncbi:MAG TPA: CPBP family intramembrane glutamic endopeptidase [Kofleriaceae bacterium]|nr:CPBP family intramembrane glutamic endopeptidase [Kofleriaceae bacterium]
MLLPLALAGVRLPVAWRVLILIGLTQGVGFIGVALLYGQIRKWPLGALGLRWPRRAQLGWIAGGYALALASAAIGGAIVVALGFDPAENELGVLAASEPHLVWLLIVLSIAIIGPGEELLFRGAIQGRLREALDPTWAIIASSLIFSAAHVLALGGGASGRATTIAVLLLPSLVFGFVYERTRSVVVPALVHGLYNATLFVLVAL